MQCTLLTRLWRENKIMLAKIGKLFYSIRRFFARSRFYVRMTGLDVKPMTEDRPGLLLIQIDGLAKKQLESAFHHNRMPFLQSLLDRQHYTLHHHYPGIPSTTPAVQGELFYGVRQGVPAFHFYDPDRKRNSVMLDPMEADKIEKELSQSGPGILEGGSAYCDIYSGSAEETHFCVSGLSPERLFRHRYPLGFLLLILFNIPACIRFAGLMIAEFALSLIDAFQGVIKGQNLIKELQFIPSRVGTCIFLRELAVIGAKIDIERNFPVIHINFLGYDEQSHRRGPSSRFAHWTLRGIDDAIKRIYRAAQHSPVRDYDLWVYSDHGQEEATDYQQAYGRKIQEAIQKEIEDHMELANSGTSDRRDNVYPGHRKRKKHDKRVEKPVVSAAGPVGHVYLPDMNRLKEKNQYARCLAEKNIIPVTLVRHASGKAIAFHRSHQFILPDDGEKLFPASYPYRKEISRDLAALCHHQYAGDIVILGWSPDQKYITFPMENGSHGGPGLQETNAFALLPSGVEIDSSNGYLRPIDIHHAVMNYRKQNNACKINPPQNHNRIRIMTYNVHSCRGLDGRFSPNRIARVIHQAQPDIVALQELDHEKNRSLRQNQIALIAQYLNMEYHFHPVMKTQSEQYGNGILSRLPIQKVHTYTLPKPYGMSWLETRGLIKIELLINQIRVNILNTHFGLTTPEKQMQVNYLIEQSLASYSEHKHIIVCGDLNLSPRASCYARLAAQFRPVQQNQGKNKPLRTWPCKYPFTQIDHIFFSEAFKLRNCKTLRTDLAATASDHLPLVAEFDIKQ